MFFPKTFSRDRNHLPAFSNNSQGEGPVPDGVERLEAGLGLRMRVAQLDHAEGVRLAAVVGRLESARRYDVHLGEAHVFHLAQR